MSTICCMLHLFGSGLGQKGSTRYRGTAAPRCWAWIRADAAIAQTAALVRTTRAALIWIFMWTVIHEPSVRGCPRKYAAAELSTATDATGRIRWNQAYFSTF